MKLAALTTIFSLSITLAAVGQATQPIVATLKEDAPAWVKEWWGWNTEANRALVQAIEAAIHDNREAEKSIRADTALDPAVRRMAVNRLIAENRKLSLERDAIPTIHSLFARPAHENMTPGELVLPNRVEVVSRTADGIRVQICVREETVTSSIVPTGVYDKGAGGQFRTSYGRTEPLFADAVFVNTDGQGAADGSEMISGVMLVLPVEVSGPHAGLLRMQPVDLKEWVDNSGGLVIRTFSKPTVKILATSVVADVKKDLAPKRGR